MSSNSKRPPEPTGAAQQLLALQQKLRLWHAVHLAYKVTPWFGVNESLMSELGVPPASDETDRKGECMATSAWAKASRELAIAAAHEKFDERPLLRLALDLERAAQTLATNGDLREIDTHDAQALVEHIELRLAAGGQPQGRWMPKSKAASLAGITMETLRGWCDRKTSAQPTRLVGGRLHVDLDAVLREQAAKAAARAHEAPANGPRLRPREPGSGKRRGGAKNDA
ncbi:MAG: hypothetical protein JNK15_11055 [Planctomycetes bacterium]|nr:hypothetical protein [Planctomycetota bacterium]